MYILQWMSEVAAFSLDTQAGRFSYWKYSLLKKHKIICILQKVKLMYCVCFAPLRRPRH